MGYNSVTDVIGISSFV